MTPPEPRRRQTIVIGSNSAWNIVNFRKPIIEALIAAGWRIIAVAPDDGYAGAIEALGVKFVPIRMQPGGTSVLHDARLYRDYLRILHAERPDAFLGFTVKPNVYGSLAAGRLRIKVINNISGLGTSLIGGGALGQLVPWLYRLALRKSAVVFFQNRHDPDLFVSRRLVRSSQVRLVPGSGIDLDHFRPTQSVASLGDPFRFLFVGRLLRDKGVEEFVQAARMLGPRFPNAEFAMLGSTASQNPSAVPIAEVKRWQQEGIVTWLGETDDVRPHLSAADCVVLPSYREGLSRSLLEASAMARPMIATDVPGCREVVEDGVTGLLCEARSPDSLASAMEMMLGLTPEERHRMGNRARAKAEREFDHSIVANAYLEALQ